MEMLTHPTPELHPLHHVHGRTPGMRIPIEIDIKRKIEIKATNHKTIAIFDFASSDVPIFGEEPFDIRRLKQERTVLS
jgi:hypothetical protein